MIYCRNLKKSYGTNEVLKDISFETDEGTVFGLLGPSGAGKTTLIKILTGQLSYDAGTVRVMGKSVDKLSGVDKKKFGIMMDQFGVYDRLSCKDNLSIFADIYGVPHTKIKEILDEVGLGDAYKKPASDLSKGMRSRLQLARAFMSSPKIIFLDEPTSGLDPETTRGIHRLIEEKKNEGCTIFLTTHNMAEAYTLCDKLILINEGRIVEEGEPEELCRRYDHQRMIRLHLRSGEDVTLSYGSDAAETIKRLMDEGRVETIHSSEPTLETVFLELTGRGFEEA